MTEVAEKSNRMPCGIAVPNQPASFTIDQIIEMSLTGQFNQLASDNLSINHRPGISLDGALILLRVRGGLVFATVQKLLEWINSVGWHLHADAGTR